MVLRYQHWLWTSTPWHSLPPHSTTLSPRSPPTIPSLHRDYRARRRRKTIHLHTVMLGGGLQVVLSATTSMS